MLLAAGRGERMEPLSSLIPKPALPLLGEPLLASSLRALWQAGCHKVVVNLHRHPEQVAAAVRQVCPERGVLFSWEPKLLGPAGGLRAAQPLLGDGPVLVANADVWSQLDVRPLLEAASDEGAVLGLVPHPDRQRWGAVHVDSRGRVVGISKPGENLQRPGYLFTGFQLLGAKALARLPDPPAPMSALWHPLMDQGRLKGVLLMGTFAEASDPEAFRQLALSLLPQTKGGAIPLGQESSFVHPLAWVHPRAQLAGSVVSVGAEVAEGAKVVASVLLPGAKVEAGCQLRGCVVAAAVGRGTVAEGQVLVSP